MWLHHCKSWENALADPLISTYIQNSTSSIFIRRLRAKLSLNGNRIFFLNFSSRAVQDQGTRVTNLWPKLHFFLGEIIPATTVISCGVTCCICLCYRCLSVDINHTLMKQGIFAGSLLSACLCVLHQNAQSSDFHLHSHFQHSRVGNIISVVIVTGDHWLLT